MAMEGKGDTLEYKKKEGIMRGGEADGKSGGGKGKRVKERRIGSRGSLEIRWVQSETHSLPAVMVVHVCRNTAQKERGGGKGGGRSGEKMEVEVEK